MTPPARLRLVKLIHSGAWLLFASAIAMIGPLAIASQQRTALWLTMLVECAVLVANRCGAR